MSWRRTAGVEGIRLTHLPTGIGAFVVRDVKPWHRLVKRARRLLNARLDAHARGLRPVTERDLVRTYHTSPLGTWTKEHRSGVRVDNVFMEMGK